MTGGWIGGDQESEKGERDGHVYPDTQHRSGSRTGVSQAFVAQRVVLADNNIGGGREDEILLALSGVGEQGKLMR